MKTLSLFSGIGGLELGLKEWCDVVAVSEIDPVASDILKHHFDVPNLGDVRKIEISPPFDAIIGGFPCQDISCAGKGAGLEGARSGLFFEIVRLINLKKPRVVFLENVSALLNRGLDVVVTALFERGYEVRWLTVPAHVAGAPHRRERIFILATKDAPTPCAALLDDLPSWTEEPNVDRHAPHGSPLLKALGNAVVPRQARAAWLLLHDPPPFVPSGDRRFRRCGVLSSAGFFHFSLPKFEIRMPASLQRLKITHSIPTPTASDNILRRPTGKDKNTAFRPGINKCMSIPRYVTLFPDRSTPVPEVDEEGYLVGELPTLRFSSVPWVTWLMGFPSDWLVK